jgi:hypothetical protein
MSFEQAQWWGVLSLSGPPGTFGSRFHDHIYIYRALGLDWI